MKTISPALLAQLFPTSGVPPQMYVADLYKFDLVDDTSLYYTSGDQNITFNGHEYISGHQSGGPFFDTTDNKAVAHFKIGVEVDTVLFDVIPYLAQIDGEGLLIACKNGLFDGAQVTISRAFMATWGNVSNGVVQWFYGRVSEIDFGRNLLTFNCSSHLELLNQPMPRNLYQAGCLNTLYDSACTLNKASFAVSGSVTSGSSNYQIKATIAHASGYFNLGSMVFTSGVNNGVSRSVKTWVSGSPGTISLSEPFPQNPSAGDTFTIYPGCDKTQSTCTNTFSNFANFRGFPYIPSAETGV